jgi:hypothetical protein
MITINKVKEYLGSFSNDLLESTTVQGFITIANKFNLTDGDLDNSLNNLIPSYFDLSFTSVKEILAIYLEEFAILGNLEQFKTKVYGGTPHQVVCFDAISIADPDAYVGFPDYLATIILGLFFGNTEQYNNYDVVMNISTKHCPFNQSKASMIMNNIIPEPNIYWINGTYCSEVAKTQELLNSLGCNWKSTVTTLSHDTLYGWDESKDDEKVKYLAKQYSNAYEEIYKASNIKVNALDISKALREYSRITKKLYELEKLINTCSSFPVSINDQSLFSLILTLKLSKGYKKYESSLDKFILEVKSKIDNSDEIENENLTKVSCSFIPLLVPKVQSELLEYGKVITHCIPLSLYDSTFEKVNYTKPYEILAEIWLRQPYSGNVGQYIDLISEKLNNYKIKNLYYGVFSFDRWLGSFEKQSIKQLESKYNIKSFNIRKQFFSF